MKLDSFNVTYNNTTYPTLEVGKAYNTGDYTEKCLIEGTNWHTGASGTASGAIDNVSEAAVVIKSVSFTESGVVTESGSETNAGKKVGNAVLKVTALGYADADSTVTLKNIPLRFSMTEVVALSKDTANISYGSILFDSKTFGNGREASSYEYIITKPSSENENPTVKEWAEYNPTDNGWKDLPSAEFANPFSIAATTSSVASVAAEGTIYVRVKANADTGYAASTPIPVTYTKSSHAGVRGATGFTVEFKDKDAAITADSTTTTGKVVIMPEDGFTVSYWRIDGTSATNVPGATVSDDKQTLIIDTATIGAGSYQVTAAGILKGVTGGNYSAGVTVVISK